MSEDVVSILWVIPQPGANLGTLIRYYTFIHRDAPPPYPKLAAVLTEAVRSEIVTVSTVGIYRVVEDWYRKLHQFDESAEHEFDAMEQVSNALDEWPPATKSDYTLSEEEYERALKQPWR
jgi:hypothetical protein